MKAANILLTKTGQPKIGDPSSPPHIKSRFSLSAFAPPADFGTSVQLQNATKGALTFTGTRAHSLPRTP